MTLGSYDSGGGYPSTSARRARSWNGIDGMYEVVDGRKRIKWNAYTFRYFDQTAQVGQTNNIVGGTGSGIPEWPAEEEFKLQSKLVKKIKGHQFNLAVSIAEGKQTVQMVLNNLKRITAALVLVKRGRFGDALRQLGANPKKGPKDISSKRLESKDLSARWLEAQYGWLPLMSDVYEAATAYEMLTRARKSYVHCSSYYVNPKRDFSASPLQYSYRGYRKTTTYLKYEMVEDISGYRSLGLLDPLSVAWEIMPWSFAIDWFLPIGSYLENLNVLPFLKGRLLRSTVCEYSAAFTADLTVSHAYAGSWRYEHGKGVNRTTTLGLSIQRPQFQTLPDGMRGKRIFNAAALAHQAVERTEFSRTLFSLT